MPISPNGMLRLAQRAEEDAGNIPSALTTTNE